MKQRVYFFRWGITTDISLISRRMGSLPLAGADPLLFEMACPCVPFAMDRSGTPPSRRLFLEAGSELDRGARPQMCREIWLNNSIYAGVAVRCSQ